VQLGDGQAKDIAYQAGKIGNLALRAEVFENIQLGYRDIDTRHIKQVLEIGNGAVGDDWKNAKIVAIVEHFRQIIGESHVAA
jgi:hypothetical protein